MKKAFFLGVVICVIGMLTACDGPSLGNGYVYLEDDLVGKRSGLGEYDIVLPPTDHWHDDDPPGCPDKVVNVFWDDSIVLAVSCYCDVMSKDTTCWKLNKKTGAVEEITPEDFLFRTHQGKMRHSYNMRRYEQTTNQQ